MTSKDLPTFTLPADLMQRIVNYMGLRPWHEVDQLMDEVREIVRAQEREFVSRVAGSPDG